MKKASEILDTLSWDDRKSVRSEVTRRTRRWVALILLSFFALAILHTAKVQGVDWLNWLLLSVAVWSVWMCISQRKRKMIEVLRERGYMD